MVNLDGTLKYFGTKHLAYALLAVIVLVLFMLLLLAAMVIYLPVCNYLTGATNSQIDAIL